MRLPILHFEKLLSTQLKARELSKKQNNFVVVCNEQTKGKGRFDRMWESTKGGLYLTICLDEKNPERIKYLTFITAISVVKTLGKLKIHSQIKWPNDVLINDKKVCGILTENILGKRNIALVGVGLNVNQRKFPRMERIPTSLSLETKKEYYINKILGMFLGYFEQYHGLYQKNNFLKIRELWKDNAHTIGKTVTIRTTKGTITGKAIGIDEECNLLVKSSKGIKKIIEGDVFY